MTLKLLLADDDQDDRLFFQDAVKASGIDVSLHSVTDGEQVISYLATADSLPDLVFLDLNMPCKNGRECLEEIRKDPQYKNLRVAVYTTSGEDREVANLEELGADIFIRKPNDFNLLCRLMADILNAHLENRVGKFEKYIYF
jgi:CheY-like chemotaxis protein